MKKTCTGSVVVYENDGRFELSDRILANDIEALRSINMFEGRNFVAVVPVTFEYDPDAEKVCAMSYRADMKLSYQIPCRREDGSYYTAEEMQQMQAELDASRA